MFGLALKSSDKNRNDTKPVAGSSSQVEGSFLFEALICEFHWTALQIAAVTSVMNACLSSGRPWTMRSCRNLLPVEASVVSLALRSWQEMGIAKEIALRIDRIYLDLAHAKRLTEPFIDVTDTRGMSGKIDFIKLEQLTVFWRKLTKDTFDAIHALEPEARWRMNGLYSQNTLILGKFLKEAVDGRHSCVDSLGEVALPVLPQRRRAPRFALLEHCKVETRGITVPAFAHDISKNGIGIACKHALALKETVIIELSSGRRFKAVVVWGKDGRVGLHFDKPLANNDPLIFG